MKYIITISLLLIFNCCNRDTEEIVKIVLNKETISNGDTLIARFYIKYDTSIAPAFYVILNSDTFSLPPEDLDYKNWIFKYVSWSEGTKEIRGYVDYLDLKAKKERSFFKFKFKEIN